MLSPEQRRWRADKLGDLANYTIGALIVGQLVTGQFRLHHVLIALAATVLIFLYSNSLLKHLH